jgi:hypothetical protein
MTAPSYPAGSDPLSAGHIDATHTEDHGTMHGRILEYGENVKAYGAKGDGATDDSAAILAAVDTTRNNTRAAFGSEGGGLVYFPPGDYIYASSTPLSCWRYQTLAGASANASRIHFTGSAGLTWPGGTHHFSMRDIGLINTGTADVMTFPEGNYVANALFINCSFEQTKTNKHIVYGASNASLVFDRFISCDFTAAPGATVNPIFISSSSNTSANLWQSCLFQANGGSAAGVVFAVIVNINASGFNYQNNFKDIYGEDCIAGMISMTSCDQCQIESVVNYDTTGVTTGDIVSLSQQGGGQTSRHFTINNIQNNGSIGGGKYVVNTNGSRYGIISAVKGVVNTGPYTQVYAQDGTVTGGASPTAYVDGAFYFPPSGASSILPFTKAGAIVDGDFSTGSGAADGMIAIDTTNSRIYVRIGGTWKSVVVA